MKNLAVFLLTSLLVSTCARAEWKANASVSLGEARAKPAYANLFRRCKAMADEGYMRSNPTSSISPLPPGWNSVLRDARVHEYHYNIADRGVTGGKKEGWVILFDAEAERLAAWIVNAVIETSADQRTYSEPRAIALAKLIHEQSGAQFPIVGLVWEDMEGTGHPKAYGFLDGLTVLGAPPSFYDGDDRTTAKLSPQVLKEGLALRWEGRAQAGRYARIASTTRDEVAALYREMGTRAPALQGNAYVGYVRDTYIQAMSSPEKRADRGDRPEDSVALHKLFA